MSSDALQGVRVLVTRPQPQADTLAQHLSRYGAEPVVMPMIEITPLFTSEILPLTSPLTDISQFNKVVAVSIPSAEIAFNLSPKKPEAADWFTPGLSTAKTLARFGITALCPDALFTSEALLQLPGLQNIAGERILLLKGEGGRDVIEQTLKARGADVVPLVLYRRVCPKYSNSMLEQTVASKTINAIVATSSQIVTHLLACFQAVNAKSFICMQPLLVPSERVAEHARAKGFTQTVVCQSAGNDDVTAALLQLIK